jgi:hypothetical protein
MIFSGLTDDALFKYASMQREMLALKSRDGCNCDANLRDRRDLNTASYSIG